MREFERRLDRLESLTESEPMSGGIAMLTDVAGKPPTPITRNGSRN
jgi:hypothetical protein